MPFAVDQKVAWIDIANHRWHSAWVHRLGKKRIMIEIPDAPDGCQYKWVKPGSLLPEEVFTDAVSCRKVV